MTDKITQINPEGTYNKKDFINFYKLYGDAQKYHEALKKDPNDTSALEKAGQDLKGDDNFYFNLRPGQAVHSLKDYIAESSNKFGEWGKKNQSSLESKLQDEDYAELVQMVPIYKKDGENSEHNEFYEAMKNYREVASIQEKGIEGIKEFVGKKIQKSKEAWVQREFSRNIGDAGYLQTVYGSYLQDANQKLLKFMYSEQDGKSVLRKDFLAKVFKDSLNEAEKAFNSAEGKGDKKEANDIWEANVRPYLMAMIQKTYEKEKKQNKKDDSSEKKDRDLERGKRRNKGMAF